MADNLGTLEYDMLISEKKLDEQLKKITEKLQAEDKKWKEILSGSGTVASPKINVSDLNSLTKANEAIAKSNLDIRTSIKELKASIKESTTVYEALSESERKDIANGGEKLKQIQLQKDQLNEYNKLLRANIIGRREAAAQAKLEADAKASLEAQRSKAFVKSNLDEEKRITQEIKAQESAIRSLEAQRSRAFVSGELEKEKRITAEIKAQEAAKRSLEAQRSRAFVAQNNKDIRDRAAAEKQLAQEQRLRLNIEAQEVGSIARLRAENTLYAFQISKLNPLIAAERAEIIKLQQARAANNAQIQNLQPTINAWGKLLSAVKTYATAYLSVQGIIAGGRAIFNQTKELDQLNFSMKTVIQNTQELANTQKFLSSVAVNYGGDLLTLSERYIKFRAAAIQSNVSAQETQQIFDSVSKAAGTLGLKTDELSGVYLALEQMLSKGKVTTEELRRQLGERLPGAFGIMANALGVTIPQLDKMLKKGEVLSTDALPKFARALEKAYGIEALKTIDTLAAAQGRMSTQFTELIRSFQASDTFKGTINAIADLLKFIRDNVGAITLLAKAFVVTSGVLSLYKLRVYAIAAAQFVATAAIGVTKIGTDAMSASMLRTAMSINTATRSWRAFGAALASNWVGLALTAVAGIVTWIISLDSEVKKTVDAMSELGKQEDKMVRSLNYQKKVIKEAGTETERYKNAIKEVNNVALKYNQTLLTQADSQDKINASINETIRLIKEEYLEKRKAKLLELAEEKRSAPIEKFREQLYQLFDPAEAYDKFLQFQELVAKGVSSTDIINSIRGGKPIFDDKAFIAAINAERKYLQEKAKIESQYPTKPKESSEVIDIEALKKNINDAKDEFERLSEVSKVGGKLAEPDFSLKFKSNKEYLQSLLVVYAKLPEALELINLELAKLDGKDSKDANKAKLESIQAQLSLLEKMKAAYDKVRQAQSEQASADYVSGLFSGQAKELNLTVNPNLNTENFNAQMEQLAVAVEKYDKKIAQTIREKIAGEATDRTVEYFKRMFEEINAEIEKFKANEELRQSIFDITGDNELAIKLSFDTKPVDDVVSYMKKKVVEIATISKENITFGNTFEELKASFANLTPELQKSIEAVDKYIADKSKNILLDSLEFIYEGIPEGTDIQFDFSKVIVELNKSLDEVKRNVEAFTSDEAIALGVDPDRVKKAAELSVKAIDEVAREATKKLGANYIKNNLPEQLANDFQNLSDASTQSIRKIVAEIDKMQNNLKSKESIQGFFKSIGLDQTAFGEILRSLENTSGLDDFLSKLQNINDQILASDKTAAEVNISGSVVKQEDVTKLNLYILLLKQLGIGLKESSVETKNKGFEKLSSNAKELGSNISGVIENVSSLSDALGIELTESGKKALEAVKTASTGITSIISSVAILAKEKISEIEKASAILAIISAALQIATAIADALDLSGKRAEEARKIHEDYLRSVTEMQLKYNIAINETIRLQAKQSIFFTDYAAQIKNASKALNDAQAGYNKILESYIFYPDTSRRGDKQTRIGGTLEAVLKDLKLSTEYGGVFDSVLRTYPEIIDKTTGKLNIAIAELVLSDKRLQDESKLTLEGLVEWAKKSEEAIKQFDDAVSSLIGNLGSDIYNALSDAWDNSTDSFMAFKGAVSQGLEDIIKQMAFNAIWAASLEEFKQGIIDSYSVGGDQTIFDNIDAFFAKAPANISATNEALSALDAEAAKRGLEWGTNKANDISSVAKGIQALTEDTGRRLEGLINSIRETQVINLGNVKQLVESNQAIQGYASESLGVLRSIDITTTNQLKLFNEIMATSSGVGGKGMKVYIQ